MKSVTIILMGLLLMLGLGTAQAADDAASGSSVAVSASDTALLSEPPGRNATLIFDNDPDSRFTLDQEILDCQPMTVWEYAISQRATVDLEYRPSATAEDGLVLVGDRVDMENIARNLMVGFSYKF